MKITGEDPYKHFATHPLVSKEEYRVPVLSEIPVPVMSNKRGKKKQLKEIKVQFKTEPNH